MFVQHQYLEHVCIAVMVVLYHHSLSSGKSVGDTVLVLVTYGLKGERVRVKQQKNDQNSEREKEIQKKCIKRKDNLYQ